MAEFACVKKQYKMKPVFENVRNNKKKSGGADETIQVLKRVQKHIPHQEQHLRYCPRGS